VAGPPAGFVAPAEPAADENNTQRAKSQPGNNAPMWRAVRETGTQPGISNLPGAEKGVLIQPFVQYPGSRFTTAGEAWRQVRNNWIIPYGGRAAGHCLVGDGSGLLDQGAVWQTGA
jgi:formate dehydrogenase subunit gamma